jgi:hypothetical protein
MRKRSRRTSPRSPPRAPPRSPPGSHPDAHAITDAITTTPRPLQLGRRRCSRQPNFRRLRDRRRTPPRSPRSLPVSPPGCSPRRPRDCPSGVTSSVTPACGGEALRGYREHPVKLSRRIGQLHRSTSRCRRRCSRRPNLRRRVSVFGHHFGHHRSHDRSTPRVPPGCLRNTNPGTSGCATRVTPRSSRECSTSVTTRRFPASARPSSDTTSVTAEPYPIHPPGRLLIASGTPLRAPPHAPP